VDCICPCPRPHRWREHPDDLHASRAYVGSAPPREDAPPACAPPTTRPTRWPAISAHTRTSSGRQLPDDLWGEYRLECVMRETFALPFVSLMEFADMRDWTDTGEETEDGNGKHGTEPDRRDRGAA